MTEVIITEHAVLRYLERVDGPHPMTLNQRIDIQAVKKEMKSKGAAIAAAIGATRFTIGDTEFRIVSDVHNPNRRFVVTCVDKAEARLKREAKRKKNRR